MAKTASPLLGTSSLFKFYATVASDTDLAEDYPGFTQGRQRRLPRGVHCNVGGDLKVELEQGSQQTLKVVAGLVYPIAPRKLISAGTTATGITVLW